MTAPSVMQNADVSIAGRPQKSYEPAISAEVNMTTAFADFITYAGGLVLAKGGAWLDIGNAPGLDVLVAWTHKTTPDVFTLLPCFANPANRLIDPTVFAPPPYIPSALATGVLPVYPGRITISKGDWTTTLSPGSTSNIKYARVYVKANGCRLVKLMGAADSATGTPTAHVEVSLGTQD